MSYETNKGSEAATQAEDVRVQSRVLDRYQTTIPTKIRELYDLQLGDFLEWSFDVRSKSLTMTPVRFSSITPSLREAVLFPSEDKDEVQIDRVDSFRAERALMK